MTFVVGSPYQYQLRAACADESLTTVVPSPVLDVVAFCTGWRVHLWTIAAPLTAAPLGAVEVPGCGSSSTKDVIMCAAWDGSGTRLAVATRSRRLVTFRLDLDFVASQRRRPPDGSISHNFKVAVDCSVDHGIILRLKPCALCVVAATSSGSIVSYSWADGSVTRVLHAAALFSRAASAPFMTAAIVDFDFTARTLCVALSDGSVVVTAAQGHGALRFDHTAMTFETPTLVSVPGVTKVALSSSRQVVMVGGTTFGSLRMYAAPTGRDAAAFNLLVDFSASLRNMLDGEVFSSCVQEIAWSSPGDTCAVMLGAKGVVVFHCSGSLLYTSFARSSVGFGRIPSKPLLASGCKAFAFTHRGHNLIVAEPSSFCFEVLELARVQSTAAASYPALLTARDLRVWRWGGGDPASSLETLPIPPEYLDDNGALWCAVPSPDGQQVMVAANHGVAIYSRRLKRWRMFGNRNQERSHACVCAPCWVGNSVVVLPVEEQRNGAASFKLTFFPRSHLDVSSVVETVHLDHQNRPAFLRCAPRAAGASDHAHILLVVEASGALRTFDVDVRTDSLAAARTLACSVGVTKTWPSFLQQQSSPPQRITDAALIVPGGKRAPVAVLLTSSLTLLIASLDNTSKTVQIIRDVFSFWIIRDPAGSLTSVDTLIAYHAVNGLNIAAADAATGQWLSSRQPQYDGETLPVGATDSAVICAAEGALHIMPRLYPSYLVRLAALPVAHYFTRRRFVEASTTSSPVALEQHSMVLLHRGEFATCFDLLVHAVVAKDLVVTTTTAAGGGVEDHLDLLRRILTYLRSYSDYHGIVVNCVRKGDVSFWKLIFDVVGAPHIFLEDCITHSRIREAVYFVRVLLMERPDDMQWSLEQSAVAARRLLAMVIAQHDFLLAYELLRFIALLSSEINLPPTKAESASRAGAMNAIENMLRVVWPNSNPNSSSAANKAGAATAAPSSAAASSLAGAPTTTTQQSTATSAPSLLGGSMMQSATSMAIRPAPYATIDDHKRHEALHRVLAQHPMIRDLIDIEAQELLKQGRVLQIVRLFEIFSLDLGQFMIMRYTSCTSKLNLSKALERLHLELGLPLPFKGSLRRVVHLTHHDSSDGATAAAVLTQTETQEYLQRCPSVQATVSALSDYLSFLHCEEFAALLQTVLYKGSVVKRIAHDTPGFGKRLRQLLSTDPWSSYAAFADAVPLPQA